MLRSAKICKKCTIFGDLRTITQERKKETRKMTPFFDIFFEILLFVILYLFLKNVKIRYHGVPSLVHSGLQNTWFFEKTYTLRREKNQFLLFQSTSEPNFSNLMVIDFRIISTKNLRLSMKILWDIIDIWSTELVR